MESSSVINKNDSELAKELDELNSQQRLTELKLDINRLIWENAHGNLTLFEAEKRACMILDIVKERPS